jgi:hypothetical protein
MLSIELDIPKQPASVLLPGCLSENATSFNTPNFKQSPSAADFLLPISL